MKKKKEEKMKELKTNRSRYLPKPLTTLACKYLEINGLKKCTHKHNNDDRKKKHGLFAKRCECKYCPMFDKKQYLQLFKK